MNVFLIQELKVGIIPVTGLFLLLILVNSKKIAQKERADCSSRQERVSAVSGLFLLTGARFRC